LAGATRAKCSLIGGAVDLPDYVTKVMEYNYPALPTGDCMMKLKYQLPNGETTSSVDYLYKYSWYMTKKARIFFPQISQIFAQIYADFLK
jgi:hypothetical protein